MRLKHLQNVAYYTDAPHVWLGANRFVTYDFRRNEFRGTEQDSDRRIWFEGLSEAEVDELDLMGRSCSAHYILWLWSNEA